MYIAFSYLDISYTVKQSASTKGARFQKTEIRRRRCRLLTLQRIQTVPICRCLYDIQFYWIYSKCRSTSIDLCFQKVNLNLKDVAYWIDSHHYFYLIISVGIIFFFWKHYFLLKPKTISKFLNNELKRNIIVQINWLYFVSFIDGFWQLDD